MPPSDVLPPRRSTEQTCSMARRAAWESCPLRPPQCTLRLRTERAPCPDADRASPLRTPLPWQDARRLPTSSESSRLLLFHCCSPLDKSAFRERHAGGAAYDEMVENLHVDQSQCVLERLSQ